MPQTIAPVTAGEALPVGPPEDTQIPVPTAVVLQALPWAA